jgi:predicted ATPase
VDQITSLVDRSLVTISPEKREGGGVRYRLLETLRQYAAEKLEEAGEADRVRAEHALHFVELVEAAGPALRTGDQLRELAVIDAEQVPGGEPAATGARRLSPDR